MFLKISVNFTCLKALKHIPITIVESDSDEEDELEFRDEQRDYIRAVERAIHIGNKGSFNIIYNAAGPSELKVKIY